LWSQTRTVTRNGTVQLFNNTYLVDPLLTGRKVELVYDPYDMSGPISVFAGDKPAGTGQPVLIGRHSHPKADKAIRDEQPNNPTTGPATGIDYLRLVAADHKAQIAAAGLDYTALTDQNQAPA